MGGLSAHTMVDSLERPVRLRLVQEMKSVIMFKIGNSLGKKHL